jgi:hypothetical protein
VLQSLVAVLDDDIARAYARYARSRERVLTIAELCAHAASRAATTRRRRTTLVAASACAMPLLLLRRSGH